MIRSSLEPTGAAGAASDGRHRGDASGTHAGRSVRCASRSSARACPGILSAIKLQERGFSDFTSTRRPIASGAPGGRTPIPGSPATFRRTSTATRSSPTRTGATASRRAAEIQAYFEHVARKYGVDKRLRLGDEVTRCEFTNGRWRLETKSGHRDEVDVVIAATGVLHHPNLPRDRGARRFRGRSLPQRALGPRRRARRPPRRHRRHRLDGRADRLRAGRPRGEALALPAHGPMGDAPGESALHATRRRPSSTATRNSVRKLYLDLSKLFTESFSNAVIDANSPQMKFVEDACRTNLETQVTGPGAAREAAPELPRGVQAPGDLARLLPGDPEAERRARHRGHRARRAARRAHARRTAARARRAGARDGLPGRPLHASDRR